jgi:hypothetical protein
MEIKGEPIAKRQENGQIEWTCPVCGGWDRLCEVYYLFLPFIDHLIRDLCVLQHPKLKHPRIVNEEVWYQIPGTTTLMPGLSGGLNGSTQHSACAHFALKTKAKNPSLG